ncbi:MAG TPA: energy transducer TonB, partial [Polyangiaceae bacterium]
MCHHDLLSRAARTASIVSVAVALVSTAPDARAQTRPSPEVTPPTVLQHVDAVYPPSAVARSAHADVVLLLTIDADGHVSNVAVASSGGADLDEAARVAARQWLFAPARRGATPVASRIKVPFHFAPPAPAPEVLETGKPNELPAQRATQAAAPAPTTGAGGPSAEPPEPEEVRVQGHIEPRFHGVSDTIFTMGALSAVPHKNAEELSISCTAPVLPHSRAVTQARAHEEHDGGEVALPRRRVARERADRRDIR